MKSLSIDDFLKRKVSALQDFTGLAVSSIGNIFSPPRYFVDTLMQMDVIGVGSLPVVLLVGLFTGGVLALQSYGTLMRFGEVGLLGQVVAMSMVRELGPVLTALMMAGRNSSGIASELGSMQVSEQIDAMRALGTDPGRKLVSPRLFATLLMMPLLTILSDFIGMLGGALVSSYTAHLTVQEYWSSANQALGHHDIIVGLLKPFLFAFVIAMVGCYFGLRTRGGTEGVGRSTTQAMVAASVVILIVNFFTDQFFVGIGFF